MECFIIYSCGCYGQSKSRKKKKIKKGNIEGRKNNLDKLLRLDWKMTDIKTLDFNYRMDYM